MRPWDVKLVSDLTESEMHDYVAFLYDKQIVEQAKKLDETVETLFESWLRARTGVRCTELRCYGPLNISTGGRGVMFTGRELRVRCPPWVPEDMAKYIIREQITEQWGQNDESPAEGVF